MEVNPILLSMILDNPSFVLAKPFALCSKENLIHECNFTVPSNLNCFLVVLTTLSWFEQRSF